MRISVDSSRGLPTPLFAPEATQLARWVVGVNALGRPMRRPSCGSEDHLGEGDPPLDGHQTTRWCAATVMKGGSGVSSECDRRSLPSDHT